MATFDSTPLGNRTAFQVGRRTYLDFIAARTIRPAISDKFHIWNRALPPRKMTAVPEGTSSLPSGSSTSHVTRWPPKRRHNVRVSRCWARRCTVTATRCLGARRATAKRAAKLSSSRDETDTQGSRYSPFIPSTLRSGASTHGSTSENTGERRC